MPYKRVFLSAMYDVQIEPTLTDRLHFPLSRQGIIEIVCSIGSNACPIGKAALHLCELGGVFPVHLIPELLDLTINHN
jgi:hypothetical protein